MKRFPGFVDVETCRSFAKWAATAAFVPGISRGERVHFRVTNRLECYGRIDYPPEVYEIQQRIRNLLHLHDAPIIEGHGKDGIVVSKTFHGGDVYEHRDPPVGENLIGLRCNVLVSKQERGGMLWVDGEPYDPELGELHCYPVTELWHRVDACYGRTPRVLFMFGFCVKEWR